MRVVKNMPLVILTLLASIATGRAATAPGAVVHVDLMDPSTSPSVKSMMIKADAQSVKAGPVTFVVSNDSKALVHEMIVVSVDSPGEPLPYDKKDNRVDESEIKDLGEALDMRPGEKKTLQLTLTPGNYELICNQPNHYMFGMRTNLIVTQ
jgi:uncharacterized cupredoxin-like copper-binding protein